jgi:hypothetical protein
MSAQRHAAPPEKVTRDDIEAKLRELRGEVEERTESARTTATAIAVGVVMATIVVAYVLGRRRGKKRQMVLEIRRI